MKTSNARPVRSVNQSFLKLPRWMSTGRIPNYEVWSKRGSQRTTWLKFFACVGFILAVSTFDTLMVVLYSDHIQDLERNPICLGLINMDPDRLTYFVLGKALGNFGVMLALIGLKTIRYRFAMAVTYSVSFFQFLLMVFLCGSDPGSGFLTFDDLGSHDPLIFNDGLHNAMIHLLVLATLVVLGLAVKVAMVVKPEISTSD